MTQTTPTPSSVEAMREALERRAAEIVTEERGAEWAVPKIIRAMMRFREEAFTPDDGVTMDGWRCFHCGEHFTSEQCARLHFGRDEMSEPACIIKAGAEGSLLKALRRAEEAADDAIQAMHAESTEAAKAYHAQRCRHTQALTAAEELGYERGLADGRALSAAPNATQQGETTAGASWSSPSLGRAYAEVERVRDALAQHPESGIDEALRRAMEAIEAADCELMGVAI